MHNEQLTFIFYNFIFLFFYTVNNVSNYVIKIVDILTFNKKYNIYCNYIFFLYLWYKK